MNDLDEIKKIVNEVEEKMEKLKKILADFGSVADSIDRLDYETDVDVSNSVADLIDLEATTIEKEEMGDLMSED